MSVMREDTLVNKNIDHFYWPAESSILEKLNIKLQTQFFCDNL